MPSDELTRDTIAAIATPAGRGGIEVVRLSPRAPAIARSILGRLPEPRRATHAIFRDARGEALDEGIALYFPEPHSYTGEPVLELQGHGGPVVMHALLAACVDAGARLADPGEFTRRAFLEGKLDLAQAEAVADLIDAASREAARSALRSLSGEFSAALGGPAIAAHRAARAYRGDARLSRGGSRCAAPRGRRRTTRGGALRARKRDGEEPPGSLLRSGIHVVLAGRPNVGKSSLLNRLAGQERAIVTSIPGTTRDSLREPVQIAGVPLVLVDTAGLRVTSDVVEQLGVERTQRELEQADVVAVYEAGGDTTPLAHLPPGAARVDVCNKIDLAPGFAAPGAAVGVSAKTGEGLERLRQAILHAAGWSDTGESVFLARERHLRALERARSHLDAAAQESPLGVFAEELRLAHAALGSITGEFSADDLLGEIFARFCIGK